MLLLMLLVPVLGGAVYQAVQATLQRNRLGRELAESRLVARDVVDELVEARLNLAVREEQVERLLATTTEADRRMRDLRGVITGWQESHESLADAARREITQWSAFVNEAERSLEDERRLREEDRIQAEQELSVMRNQMAATSYELRETQEIARQAGVRNQELERDVRSLASSHHFLSSQLSSAQSDLSDAQSEASSAESAASTAESQRDRARHALARAGDRIDALRRDVAFHHREEVRENPQAPHPAVDHPRPGPGNPPPRHDPPAGGRRAR